VKPSFVIELLGAHDREGFSCATESLDTYFRSQVTQDVRRHVTNCFVAVDADTRIVAGFFTIAAASIPTPDLPGAVTKKLPRYPSLPAIRVGRLAVDSRFRGRGLGGALLADAAEVLGGDRQAAICRELTKIHETFDRGTLADLAHRYADHDVKGEIVLVVAPPDERAAPDEADVDAALREALATMSVKEAAQAVAAATGLSRRELYQRALALKSKA